MESQQIIFTNQIEDTLTNSIKRLNPDQLFILTDSHTHQQCLPIIRDFECLQDANISSIPSGDENKTVQSLMFTWKNLSSLGASRQSLLINLGGGMITDLGGFAASTFKRGMRCLNIPTTLLAMVDASLGGKTGINFNGFKNEVGNFFEADSVLIHMPFLQTLDKENKLSGYAEMLKHGLIYDIPHYDDLLNYEFNEQSDLNLLAKLVEESIQVKQFYVSQDPHEKGLRKILNLGHTIGHAFESYAMTNKKPVLHGYAVAWGLICELYIAHKQCDFPKEDLKQLIDLIKDRYGVFEFTCKSYDKLYEYVLHDKKNTKGTGIVTMPLLQKRGLVSLDETIDKELILESFDFYRDFMGI